MFINDHLHTCSSAACTMRVNATSEPSVLLARCVLHLITSIAGFGLANFRSSRHSFLSCTTVAVINGYICMYAGSHQWNSASYTFTLRT